MYKYILILIATLTTTACTGMAPIKDRYHKAPFEKQIEKGDHEIVLYKVDYPNKYEEKIKFYNDFDLLMKKLLVYDYTVNILFPGKLKMDVEYLKTNYLLPEERIFSKPASELSQLDEEKIDKIVTINLNKNLGQVQYYLNKQVYFWKKISKDRKKYDPAKNYTELDKEKLILKMEEKRKNLFNIISQVDLNLVLQVGNPYFKHENMYWQKKDVYIDRNTTLNPKNFIQEDYLYLNSVKDSDVKKIMGGEIKFNSKVVVIDNDLYNGYTVVDGKYVFFDNGRYETHYYDGYKLGIKIKEVSLEELLKADKKLLIDDFLYPNIYEERQEK